MSAWVIAGGRVLDPATGLDERSDIWIADGHIAAIGAPPAEFPAHERIDASGRVVCPGLVDLCARLREPGETHKGTIASETRAAAAGGITTVCCPPDTVPAIDSPATVEFVRQRAVDAGYAHVRPMGALTRGLEGEYLAPMRALIAAGCVALGQAERSVRDTQVLRAALDYAATHDFLVLLPPLDPWIATGCAAEGALASRLGLSSIPVSAETAELGRILALVADTGARVHVGRLSSAAAVEQIARARADGLPVSADVAAHQLHLTDSALRGLDARVHVRPPLRSAHDRDALREAVAAGVIEAICSDHQPHESDAKRAPFAASAPGVSALETLLPLVLTFAEETDCGLATALARVTAGPAALLGLHAGTLTPGAPADLCLFDPQQEWTLEGAAMVSRGRNTPFEGNPLRGRVDRVLLAGEPLLTDA
ncbi:MAG: dihydroorotase [Halofilum sp. (in: g-proteobacteria)]